MADEKQIGPKWTVNGNTATVLNLLKIIGIIGAVIYALAQFIIVSQQTRAQLGELKAQQTIIVVQLTTLSAQMNNHLGWTDARDRELDAVIDEDQRRLDRLESITLGDALDRKLNNRLAPKSQTR